MTPQQNTHSLKSLPPSQLLLQVQRHYCLPLQHHVHIEKWPHQATHTLRSDDTNTHIHCVAHSSKLPVAAATTIIQAATPPLGGTDAENRYLELGSACMLQAAPCSHMQQHAYGVLQSTRCYASHLTAVEVGSFWLGR